MAKHLPLALDKHGKPLELPSQVEGFAVYRLPSAAGGKPGRVMHTVEGRPEHLCVAADTEAEQLYELVGRRPGRFKLVAIDEDGEELDEHVCWVTLERPQEGPPPSTAVEAALLTVVREQRESIRELVTANVEVVKHVAGMRAARMAHEVVDAEVDEDAATSIVTEAVEKSGGAINFLKELLDLSPKLVENAPHLVQLASMVKGLIAAKKASASNGAAS